MSLQRFYNRWLEQFHTFTNQLKQSPPPESDEANCELFDLVQETLAHYAAYYQVKSLAARQDVLQIFEAPSNTDMERSLLWIAGWRPTTVFHLIYSELSVRFESQIFDLIRGIHNGDLGDLSPEQFHFVNKLQCETVRGENAITDELAEWQEGDFELIGNTLPRMNALAEVVEKADGLRLRTVEKIVELLTPQQAAEFLVAASQLQTGIHGCGVEHDRN